MPTVEKIAEDCVLGEGPHWDISSQSLFFVDIPKNSILKYTPSTKRLTKARLEKRVAFIIPLEGRSNEFIISQENELVIISWDGEPQNVKTVQKICAVETSAEPATYFNDAKCDSFGRLWTGTLSLAVPDSTKTQPLGTLYSINANKQVKSHIDKLRISNGIAFNDKTKKMFFIDSLAYTVDQFDFDIVNDTISNRKPWFTFEKFEIPGKPDGMTIDSDGNLWVAVIGGSRVLKIDGSVPETLLETINIPTKRVTSVAFGGQNLDELFVTTGWDEPHGPTIGATYRVTGLNVKGVPAVNFRINK